MMLKVPGLFHMRSLFMANSKCKRLFPLTRYIHTGKNLGQLYVHYLSRLYVCHISRSV